MWSGWDLQMEHRVVGTLVRVDRPVLAEAVESTGRGVAAERGALGTESALTMKLNGAENCAGPASKRRDNIGAPATQTSIHTRKHTAQRADKAAEAFS